MKIGARNIGPGYPCYIVAEIGINAVGVLAGFEGAGAEQLVLAVDEALTNVIRHGYGGRVAVGHVSKLSALPMPRLAEVSQRLADAGVAVTVLPATDLFLMGVERDHDIVRGVAPVHRLLPAGVNCSLSTNNLLNPFTPFGDGSLLRMANLYANVGQLKRADEVVECFEMITGRSAQLLRLPDYGIAIGHPADLVVLDCETPEAAPELLLRRAEPR